MDGKQRVYIAIDLKSFYASVECVERQLDPLATNLVVADAARTEKTICLAVSPSLKAYGISGRARLFEGKGRPAGNLQVPPAILPSFRDIRSWKYPILLLRPVWPSI